MFEDGASNRQGVTGDRVCGVAENWEGVACGGMKRKNKKKIIIIK